ncbi:uncharacterized protein LOC112494480 [Cephus cinctus]|uniref:Uncharacterized protein LOC112494480 n=1 Tax=Cephus cinctus TaxID=211228 RepID=A0AAJ7RIH8_CEPCN|nr:uncharacterized protein LOC112494480 [Cephus cinctus]
MSVTLAHKIYFKLILLLRALAKLSELPTSYRASIIELINQFNQVSSKLGSLCGYSRADGLTQERVEKKTKKKNEAVDTNLLESQVALRSQHDLSPSVRNERRSEMAARLHDISPRRQYYFVHINITVLYE